MILPCSGSIGLKLLRGFHLKAKLPSVTFNTPLWFVTFCAICYHLYNLKNVKSIHGRVLLLVKLQAEAFPLAFLTFPFADTTYIERSLRHSYEPCKHTTSFQHCPLFYNAVAHRYTILRATTKNFMKLTGKNLQ